MYPFPCRLKLCQGKEKLLLQVVLADASLEELPESKVTFDDPKGMLHFRVEVGLRHLNEI